MFSLLQTSVGGHVSYRCGRRLELDPQVDWEFYPRSKERLRSKKEHFTVNRFPGQERWNIRCWNMRPQTWRDACLEHGDEETGADQEGDEAADEPAAPQRGGAQPHDPHGLLQPRLLLVHHALNDHGHRVDPGQGHEEWEGTVQNPQEPGEPGQTVPGVNGKSVRENLWNQQSEKINNSIQFNFICIALLTKELCHKAALQRTGSQWVSLGQEMLYFLIGKIHQHIVTKVTQYLNCVDILF